MQIDRFSVPPNRAKSFLTKVTGLGLCDLGLDPHFGADGATWLFETATDPKPCAAARWSPDGYSDDQSQAFTAAGRMALDLAGLHPN